MGGGGGERVVGCPAATLTSVSLGGFPVKRPSSRPSTPHGVWPLAAPVSGARELGVYLTGVVVR